MFVPSLPETSFTSLSLAPLSWFLLGRCKMSLAQALEHHNMVGTLLRVVYISEGRATLV